MLYYTRSQNLKEGKLTQDNVCNKVKVSEIDIIYLKSNLYIVVTYNQALKQNAS